MAVLQSMRKNPSMKKIIHLKNAFVQRIKRMLQPYEEGRIIFDRYDIDQSLKQKTRAKRTQGKTIEFKVHDEMSITGVSLRDLLSSTKTKENIAELFGDAVLNAYEGSEKKVVVGTGTTICINHPHSIDPTFAKHSHEEADTMIPMHVINAVKDSPFKDIDVWSPDTDVLILLMDLVAHDRISGLTKLKLVTGIGNKVRSINIPERVAAIGHHKCQGLIGLHNFSGADWGGRFVGISKKNWITSYLSLPTEDPIIDAFRNLGDGNLTEKDLVEDELPLETRPIERFVCSVYKPGGPQILPDLRWELFRSKNLEGEKLPPTRATLLPHLLHANFVSLRDKSYVRTEPNLPPLDENGWKMMDESLVPVCCVHKPAPKAVLELIKCGCKAACTKSNCSCNRNNLPCTPLCKCHNSSCSNSPDYKVTIEEDDYA